MRGTWTFGVVTAAVLAWAATAVAVQEDLLEKARALVEEARPWVAKANNTDLETGERRVPRKEAYKRLKEARELYGKYFDANPSQVEPLDGEYVQMNSLFFGIKKDASINEFDDRAPPLELPGTPPPAPRPTPKEPTAPPKEPPAGAPPAPAPPPPAPTPSDLPDRARLQFDALTEYEARHKGDLPTLHELYEKFLAEYDDPSLPEYSKAVERLGAITDRLRNVFQKETSRDFDSLANLDTKNLAQVVTRLTRELNGKDLDLRLRAARLLGATRAGAATYPLAKAIDDKDAAISHHAEQALVAIGGGRMGEMLVKLYRDRDREKQQKALRVLVAVARKSPVDARAMSRWIGRFVLSNDPQVAEQALNDLTGLGMAAGPGLVEAIYTKIPGKKVAVMEAMVAAKYWKGAAVMGMYLVTGDGHDLEMFRSAAIKNLKAMGAYAVPHLIPLLRTQYKQYTALVLREITGERLGFNDSKEWWVWWEKNRPADAE